MAESAGQLLWNRLVVSISEGNGSIPAGTVKQTVKQTPPTFGSHVFVIPQQPFAAWATGTVVTLDNGGAVLGGMASPCKALVFDPHTVLGPGETIVLGGG